MNHCNKEDNNDDDFLFDVNDNYVKDLTASNNHNKNNYEMSQENYEWFQRVHENHFSDREIMYHINRSKKKKRGLLFHQDDEAITRMDNTTTTSKNNKKKRRTKLAGMVPNPLSKAIIIASNNIDIPVLYNNNFNGMNDNDNIHQNQSSSEAAAISLSTTSTETVTIAKTTSTLMQNTASRERFIQDTYSIVRNRRVKNEKEEQKQRIKTVGKPTIAKGPRSALRTLDYNHQNDKKTLVTTLDGFSKKNRHHTKENFHNSSVGKYGDQKSDCNGKITIEVGRRKMQNCESSNRNKVNAKALPKHTTKTLNSSTRSRQTKLRSVRDVQKWEGKTGQQYFLLSPGERRRADNAIEIMLNGD